jgi:hypothetical protein
VSGQVTGFTEAQIREMTTRGAALDGTRPSDWWRWTGDLSNAVLVDSTAQTHPAEDADSSIGRWQGLAKIECGLQAS